MKSLFIVVMLAALSISYDAAVIKDEDVIDVDVVDHVGDVDDVGDVGDVGDVETRSNLSQGSIGSGDRLLARNSFSRSAVANAIVFQEITYSGKNVRITAIRVTRIGSSQGASASIRSGGVGRNFVTIRLQSARGRGYAYTIEIYGR